MKAIESLSLIHLHDWNSGFKSRINYYSVNLCKQRNAIYYDFKQRFKNIICSSYFSLFEKVLNQLDFIDRSFIERISKSDNIILIHNDAHLGNYIFLNDKSRSPLIIDWQFWSSGVGAYDVGALLFGLDEKRMLKEQVAFLKYYWNIINKKTKLFMGTMPV